MFSFSMKKTLIVIVGPTAMGKTELAIQLAKHYNTEIVSADSRQIYQELDIGVARPSAAQLSKARHHFIACRSVEDEYNAGEFEKDALKCLENIFSKHDIAVMVGGSGLYVRAVCEGLDAVPSGDNEVRKTIEDELRVKGLKHLQDELKQADLDYFKSADIQNPRRVIRALEVYRITGKSFSAHHSAEVKKRDFNIVKIGLNAEREVLYERINQRVDAMMQRGLLDEVKKLLPLRACKALQTVGYQELFDFLDDKTDLETAANFIKQHTRNFAKRQLTWFRKEKDIHWFEPEREDEVIAHINREISKT